MRKRFLTGIVIFCLLSLPVLATGSSQIIAELRPVSINPAGAILCKTKFQPNSEGYHRLMPVHYGWAVVLPKGSIKEYPFHYFDSDSYADQDLCFKHYEYLEKIYQSEVDWANPPVSLLPLIDKYGFNSNNTKKFLVNQQMPREAFLKKYQLTMPGALQLTLQNHHSKKYGAAVLVVYDFKNLLFLRNYIAEDKIEAADRDDAIVGASFDFYVEYQQQLFDYGWFEITGVIALNVPGQK